MPSHFSPIQLFATPWTIVYRLPCPWDSPGKNTGVGYHAPLQGIFLTQGLNLHLLHCRKILYCWATGEAAVILITPAMGKHLRTWSTEWDQCQSNLPTVTELLESWVYGGTRLLPNIPCLGPVLCQLYPLHGKISDLSLWVSHHMSMSSTYADSKLGSKLQGWNPGRNMDFPQEECKNVDSIFKYHGIRPSKACTVRVGADGWKREATTLSSALPALCGLNKSCLVTMIL